MTEGTASVRHQIELERYAFRSILWEMAEDLGPEERLFVVSAEAGGVVVALYQDEASGLEAHGWYCAVFDVPGVHIDLDRIANNALVGIGGSRQAKRDHAGGAVLERSKAGPLMRSPLRGWHVLARVRALAARNRKERAEREARQRGA